MKKIALVMTLLMLMLSFAGCGGNEATSPGSGNAESESRTDLNLRSSIQLQTSDPSQTRAQQNIIVLDQVYEGLYKLNEAKGGYELAVAKSCDISDDGLVYTFKIRDGLKFHNGDPVKASDVVFSYEKYMSGTMFDAYTNMIKSVEAPDDSTAVITLNVPYSPIAHTFHTVKIFSEKEVSSQGDGFGTKVALAGTGPYMLDTYDPAIKVTLKAFPDYWQGETPIETVNFITILDDAAALIAFQNGELDWLPVPMADWDSIASSDQFNTEIIQGNWSEVMAVNYQRNEVLGNQKVREAIAHAIDRDAMNMATFEGYGTPTWDYMPVKYVTATPTEYTKYEYDPELSKKLLTEAGYPDGVDIGNILTYAPVHDKTAQVLQANLAEVGIKAGVQVLESSVAIDKMNVQDFDICIFADYGNYDFNNFRQQADSRSKGMYMVKYEGDVFDWKHFDELCDQGAAITDVNERKAIYTELYDAIMKSATLYPVLHSPVANAWVKDLKVINSPSYYSLYGWEWENAQ
ncbi:MAG TPA: ABC transporter substrate-binding protein [Anaerovoracaceae bacterium]|nr:ABC transporter substrate-binding protein [Anaerovoracaceae bacterium]